MLANVVAFPSAHEGQTLTDIPSPLFYSPGDDYIGMKVSDNSLVPLGLCPGAVAIFLKDFRRDGGLYLVTCRGERQIIKSEQLPSLQAKVYGALAELYPAGLAGPRLVSYREDRARIMAPAHPELGMEMRLVAASL